MSKRSAILAANGDENMKPKWKYPDRRWGFFASAEKVSLWYDL